MPDDHGLDEGRGAAVVGQVRHEQHAGGAGRLGSGLRQVDGEVSRGQDAFLRSLLTVRGPTRRGDRQGRPGLVFCEDRQDGGQVGGRCRAYAVRVVCRSHGTILGAPDGLVSQGRPYPCKVPGEGLRAAEDRGFEPLRVLPPNRISSSGRDCPDRFKLDQLRRPDFPERRGTAMNCNPNCNRGLSAWEFPG
jgi:hypothetical protein